MKKFLLVLVFALVPMSVFAATGVGSLTFTPPTTYVNGSPLLSSSITGYLVTCEFKNTGATTVTPCALIGSPLPGGTTTSGSVTLTYPPGGGEACFSLSTMVGSILSTASSPKACKTFDPLVPNPPSNVAITVTLALKLTSETPITVALTDVKVEK